MTGAARPAKRSTQPTDLLHHGLVAALLGLPMAVWLSGALVYHAVDAAHDIATYQVTMWLVPLLWASVIGLAFTAPSKRACWAGLLAANLLSWLLLKAVQP